MRVSTFNNLAAQSCNEVDIEWDQFAAYFADPPEYATKADCPLLKMAEFGDVRSAKGSIRHDANVLAICGVEGDHDAESLSPEDACRLLIAAGIKAIVYTSASHGRTGPRWRVLAPTSQRYAPQAHRELVGRLNTVLGGVLSTESFALSQAYYFGRVLGVDYVAYGSPGLCIDQVEGLVATFPASNHEGTADGAPLSDGPVPEWVGPTDDAELLRRALNARSAASAFGTRACFADLWERNTEVLAKAFPAPGRMYEESEADAALVAHLAFWTGRDGERIERLMLQSGLYREKYDRADGIFGTHLRRTIASILGRPGNVLTDTLPEPPSLPQAAAEAPVQAAVSGNTFLNAEGQKGLFHGCVYVLDRHRVLVPGGHLLKPEQFKVAYGGYAFSMDNVNERTSRNAWEAFTESQALRAPRADTICFKPNLPSGVIVDDAGRTRVNTYWPAKIRRTVGDVSPFTNHLRKMLPDERDCEILMSYMAACVQYQGVKFQWAPVMQGAEGNGKSTLLSVVSEAVGQHYTHWPKATDLASDFNGWLANKTFIAVEELKAKDHAKSDEIVDNLHIIVAGGRGTQIQFKGVDQESMAVCANVMVATNHRNVIRKTKDNARRFCMFYMAQQTLADIERDGMGGDYFPRLHSWLNNNDGWAIVSELLHSYPIAPEFNPAGNMHRAPNTSTTDMVIAESRGGVEQQIAEAIAQDTPGFMGGWVSSVMLDRFITDTLKMGNRLSHAKRRELLQGMGYILHPGLIEGRVNNPIQPDNRKPQLFILANHPSARITGAAEIARAYTISQNATLRASS